MQLGMIGLGRMGSNMVRRLMRGGHDCVVYDRSAGAVEALVKEGAIGATSVRDLAQRLAKPRALWLMVPAGVVDDALEELAPQLARGDVVVDGGNSYYVDDMRRAGELAGRGIHYVDAGTSGGVWGLERGYCLMIGGPGDAVQRPDPGFRPLAPGPAAAPPPPGGAVRGGRGRSHRRQAGAGARRPVSRPRPAGTRRAGRGGPRRAPRGGRGRARDARAAPRCRRRSGTRAGRCSRRAPGRAAAG